MVAIVIILVFPLVVLSDVINPFGDIRPQTNAPTFSQKRSFWNWDEGITWRREFFGLGIVELGNRDAPEAPSTYARFSAGLEAVFPFATPTRTIASANLQLRLVWRDRPLETTMDPMGRNAPEWHLEIHNAYVDLVDPLAVSGRFNLRLGRAYLPFGLNVQTDTHATLLPLSNDRLFGTERDWQITAYGNATDAFDYWVGCLLGTGMDQEMKGQHGLFMGRWALGNRFLYERGLEGGAGVALGERMDPHRGTPDQPVRTWRTGIDARYRWATRAGSFTATVELAGGEDASDAIVSFLNQFDWLGPTRRWSFGIQYWAIDREKSSPELSPGPHQEHIQATPIQKTELHPEGTQQGATLVGTRYFRNDPTRGALHWIALALEIPFDASHEIQRVRPALHYYRYW